MSSVCSSPSLSLKRNRIRTVADVALCSDCEICCICLESISFLDRSSLDRCEHIYHKDCILSWSGIENACPLCKQRFNIIHHHYTNNKINIDLKIQPLNTDNDLDTIWIDCVCDKCGYGDNEQLLLFCDECNCMAHTYCIGLGHNIPTHYFCDSCTLNRKIKQIKKEKQRTEWRKYYLMDFNDKHKIKTYARNNKQYKSKHLKVNTSNIDTKSKSNGNNMNESTLSKLPSPSSSSRILIVRCGKNRKRILRFKRNLNNQCYGNSLVNLFRHSYQHKNQSNQDTENNKNRKKSAKQNKKTKKVNKTDINQRKPRKYSVLTQL